MLNHLKHHKQPQRFSVFKAKITNGLAHLPNKRRKYLLTLCNGKEATGHEKSPSVDV